MTPEQLLESDSLTASLKAKGWTDEELRASRFMFWNPELPFALWSIACPDQNDLKKVDFAILRAYVTLRWLLIDNPPSSRNRDDAWAYVADVKAAPLMEAGQRYIQAQRERATKPRGVLWSGGPTMKALVEGLATRSDLVAESPRGLWPHLISELRGEEDLSPEAVWNESEPRKSTLTYEPGSAARGDDAIRKSITYGRFCTIVSHARKIRRHVSPVKE